MAGKEGSRLFLGETKFLESFGDRFLASCSLHLPAAASISQLPWLGAEILPVLLFAAGRAAQVPQQDTLLSPVLRWHLAEEDGEVTHSSGTWPQALLVLLP